MEKETGLPSWIIFLLIALGVVLSIGVALVLSQIDAMQQRALLPRATMPAIDREATVSAGDLTVVVIVGENSQTSTPTPVPATATETPQPATATATFGPIRVTPCSAAPQDWVPFEVQEGDTLPDLALAFDVGIDTLLEANCLRYFELLPGQALLVPAIAETRTIDAECVVPQDWDEYTIQPGDTLAELALRFNTTAAMLVMANCLEEAALESGSTLYVPPTSGQDQMPMPPTPTPGPVRPAHWTPRPPMWPTATRQMWATVTPTATATRINLPQNTATATPTATTTPLVFLTLTPTNTPQPPEATSTTDPSYPAGAPSKTPTPTETNTPQPTATATLVPPATATNTPSPTSTSTVTPSLTPSPTLTHTPTHTPSPTPTFTPSPTTTFTPKPTRTPSRTPSPTATGSVTPPATATTTSTPLPYPYP